MNASGHQEALAERDAAWSALAASGGDVDEIVDFWTSDAVVIPPGMAPMVGTEALHGYITASLSIPGFRISWTTDAIDMSQDGTMAWVRGDNLVEMTGEDGAAVSIPGRAITVWRNEDGVWRCCADVWNNA